MCKKCKEKDEMYRELLHAFNETAQFNTGCRAENVKLKLELDKYRN